MATKNDDRAQQLLQLQQTVADAQLVLAEALRALSQGQAVGAAVSRDAPPETTGDSFIHTGELAFGRRAAFNDPVDVLYLANDPDEPSLNWLADNNKRIRLEFQLRCENALSAAQLGESERLFDALATFLRLRAESVTPMKAQCCEPTDPSCRAELPFGEPPA